MAMIKHQFSPPAAALAFLLEGLAAISRSSPEAHRRRIDRAAITFRPCKQGSDGLPDHPIPIDEFRLHALNYRWAAGRRGPRPEVTLRIYRPTFDRSHPLPIRFRCDQVHDLVRPRSLTGYRPNATAIRSAIVLHQAAEDAGPGELAPGLQWPRFFYGFRASRQPEFAADERAAADASEMTIDGLKAWPAELFVRDEGRLHQACRPDGTFASLAHVKGRMVRNPAFEILKRHGLLPRHQDYGSWLATVSVRLEGVRVIHDPKSERSETARLRRLIESHVLAERGREAAILGDLEAGCLSMGVKLTEGPERLDRLAELLDNPWVPAALPYAGRAQIIQLAGSTSRVLTDPVSELDLEEPIVARRQPEGAAREIPGRLLRG